MSKPKLCVPAIAHPQISSSSPQIRTLAFFFSKQKILIVILKDELKEEQGEERKTGRSKDKMCLSRQALLYPIPPQTAGPAQKTSKGLSAELQKRSHRPAASRPPLLPPPYRSCLHCDGAKAAQGPPQFSSVSQSCLTLYNPMNLSTPGLPIHHQLPEFTQTQVGDAIQPSHLLSSPSPALNLSQHQGLFK